MHILTSVAGMALILALAVLLSADRKAISLRVVAPAFALQAGLAGLVLYVPPGRAALGGSSGSSARSSGSSGSSGDTIL